MANWHAMQKRKREIMDTPLQEDMVSSGGAHNQNKGYGESDGPPMKSPLHDEGHGGGEHPSHGFLANAKNTLQNSSFNKFSVGTTGEANKSNSSPFGPSRQKIYKNKQAKIKGDAHRALVAKAKGD